MRFFRKQLPSPEQPQIEGLLAYYGLVDWWLATFTPKEREEIAFMQAPLGSDARPLTQGHVSLAWQSAADFLANLAETYFQGENNSIGMRIRAKVKALGGEPHPGIYKGKHYTAYVEQVKQLKRDGDTVGAERLLLALVDLIEREGRIRQWDVAPWYYEELAKLYRQRKDYAHEVAILERYLRQPRHKNATVDDLQQRLEKARLLLAKSAT